MTSAPGWAWAAAAAAICCLLGIDLLVTRRAPAMPRAALLAAAWVGAGIAFGLVLTLWQGGHSGQAYFTAYLVEETLSIDNLLVFAVLFHAFAVPAAYQHRVLFFGVIGAIAARGAFIGAGAALIHQLSWAFYVFGAVLLAAAFRMARGGVRTGPGRGAAARHLSKILPVTEDYDGARFLTRRDGALFATPLLMVLVAIETADVVFAIDSIPAVFGVTTDVFIVFTSNAFAILGLRALYFVLVRAMDRVTYLNQGLAVLLAFIGAKMILAPVLHVPTLVSLATIIVIITSTVLLSLRKRARVRRSPA
jgi:TerC family integral membrane protein